MPVALPSDRSIQVAIHSIGSVWGIGVLLLSSLLIFILYIFLLKSGTTAFKDHSQPETHQQKKTKTESIQLSFTKTAALVCFYLETTHRTRLIVL